MKYCFSLAGISLICDIPFEINISQESLPFIREASDFSADTTLKFERVCVISAPTINAVWQGDISFSYEKESMIVYYAQIPFGEPYARLIWNKNRSETILCEYTEKGEQKIRSSQNLMNLLGLETFLLMHDALLLHASFIVWKGNGILFTAPSGTGKSTQADLWECFERARIINGDRAGLRKVEGVWHAYGLPYAGTSGIYKDESAPVTTIAVLRQSKENSIRKLSKAEALRYIYPELSIHRWDSAFVDKALNLFLDLSVSVQVYLLECLPDKGAVQLLKHTLEEGTL